MPMMRIRLILTVSRKAAFLLQSNDIGSYSWSGERQRAGLRGFARLRAILWRRSLRLYQGWKLADQPWYSPLARALRQTGGGLDLFSADRVRQQADVFGETPVLTTVRLLQLAEAHLGKPSQFVDLGCGRGVTCLTSASMGISALGFEREPAWVQAAQRVSRQLNLPARFVAGDFLHADWPAGALYLVVATAYPEDMREEIAERLVELHASVITADWSLPQPSFRKVWQGRLPVEWGVADFALWSPKQADQAPWSG